MPSPTQDTVACTCPSCGNLFAVKASFLGRQVKCPICAMPVTAATGKQEEGRECTIPCRCNVCSNPFAIKLSCLGCQVKCPICHSTVTATQDKPCPPRSAAPETDKTDAGQEEQRPRPPAAQLLPPPLKKTDKRSITPPPSAPAPASGTTRIRKRREQRQDAPSIATAGSAALAAETPEYRPPSGEAAREERRPTWHIWLFVTGLVLAALGTLMFIRGSDLEAERSKMLNISDRFVDHEADFSTEVNKDLLKALQERAEQYQLTALTRKQEDREAETVSKHVTAAMNELALYCMATSDEERLHYVMDPAAVRPKMAHWAPYGQYKDYLPQEAGRSTKNGDLLQISVLMDDNTVHPAIFLYDHATGKWKLDWEAWEGYSPMFPEELAAGKPSAPVPVRVSISVAGIYRAPFLEESSPESYRNSAYVNFSLEFPRGERLNAYVDRYSPLALELMKLLQSGPVRACVTIHYPADLPGSQAVLIDKLVHSGWMSDATRALLPNIR